MSELYLILHKVRGEPAFDIAQKIMIGGEEGWIVPTSGHRAYPHQGWPLGELMWSPTTNDPGVPVPDIAENIATNPDLPDHYDPKRDNTPLIDKLRSAMKFKTKPTAPPLRRL